MSFSILTENKGFAEAFRRVVSSTAHAGDTCANVAPFGRHFCPISDTLQRKLRISVR